MDKYCVNKWVIDVASNRLYKDDQEVILQKRVMDLLVYFIEHADQVVTRDQMIDDVWKGAVITDDAVTNSIVKLRKSFGDKAKNPDFIQTIPKVGYRFVAKVGVFDQLSHSTNNASGEAVNDENTGSSLQGTVRNTLSKTVLISVSLFLTISALISYFYWPSSEITNSMTRLAVMPFEYIGKAEDKEYLAKGLSIEVASNLASIEGLRVSAATSSQIAMKEGVNIETIGKMLNTDYLVYGTVQTPSNQILVSIQVVNVATKDYIWAKSYNVSKEQLIDLQLDIVHDISYSFDKPFGIDTVKTLFGENKFDAYDLYLLGNHHSDQRTTNSLTRAAEYYKQAIEVDPDFALAYTGIATNYLLNVTYGGAEAKLAEQKAKQYNDLALKIIPDLPQALVISAMLISRINYQKALEYINNAIRLKPNMYKAYFVLGQIESQRGNLTKSLEAFNQALSINPLDPAVIKLVARIQVQTGNFEQGVSLLKSAIDSSSVSALLEFELALSYYSYGFHEKAQYWLESARSKEPDSWLNYSFNAFILHMAGKKTEAKKFIDDLSARIINNDTFSSIPSLFISRFYIFSANNKSLDEFIEDTENKFFKGDINSAPAQMLQWVGTNYLLQKDYNNSIKALAASLSYYRTAGVDDEAQLEILGSLAAAYLANKDAEKFQQTITTRFNLYKDMTAKGWGKPSIYLEHAGTLAMQGNLENAYQVLSENQYALNQLDYIKVHPQYKALNVDLLSDQ